MGKGSRISNSLILAGTISTDESPHAQDLGGRRDPKTRPHP